MKAFWWGLIAGIVLSAVAGGIIGLSMLGKKATVEPPDWEAYVVNKLKRLEIPEAEPPAAPLEVDDEFLVEGGEHYNHHCAVCHDLEGDADSDFAKAFYPPVSDLTSGRVQDYSDRQLKWIVQYGIRYTGMPGWEGIVGEEEQWKITHYLRALADPEKAGRLEEMLKVRGKWNIEPPGGAEHAHTEEGEHIHGAPTGEQAEREHVHHGAEHPVESPAEPARARQEPPPQEAETRSDY